MSSFSPRGLFISHALVAALCVLPGCSDKPAAKGCDQADQDSCQPVDDGDGDDDSNDDDDIEGDGDDSSDGDGDAAGDGDDATGGDGDEQVEPTSKDPSMLPAAPSNCPTLSDGDVMFGTSKVRVWVGKDGMSKLGPLVIYWHGTCSGPIEASFAGIGQDGISRIKELGGMVAAIDSQYKSPDNFCQAAGLPATTACPGKKIGNGVWCQEDFDVADDIVACAIQQVGIDVQHIHTAGMSAGGVTAAAFGYARSGYLASLTSYSGGTVSSIIQTTNQDPSNKFAAMIVHGGESDQVGVNFKTIGEAYQAELTRLGHFAFICDHGMGHTIPTGIGRSTVQFFEDHPFGVMPEPYEKKLPAEIPEYCSLP